MRECKRYIADVTTAPHNLACCHLMVRRYTGRLLGHGCCCKRAFMRVKLVIGALSGRACVTS